MDEYIVWLVGMSVVIVVALLPLLLIGGMWE